MRVKIVDLPDGFEVVESGGRGTLTHGEDSAQVEIQGDEIVFYTGRLTSRQRRLFKLLGYAEPE